MRPRDGKGWVSGRGREPPAPVSYMSQCLPRAYPKRQRRPSLASPGSSSTTIQAIRLCKVRFWLFHQTCYVIWGRKRCCSTPRFSTSCRNSKRLWWDLPQDGEVYLYVLCKFDSTTWSLLQTTKMTLTPVHPSIHVPAGSGPTTQWVEFPLQEKVYKKPNTTRIYLWISETLSSNFFGLLCASQPSYWPSDSISNFW